MFHLLVILAFCAAQVMGEDEWGRAIRKKNFRETLKKFESGSIQHSWGTCAVHQMAYQAPLPGMAVEAAWVPVCAEGLTWRQLPLLF